MWRLPLLFSTITLFFFVSFQNKPATVKPDLKGFYYNTDTNKNRDYCKLHTLALKADSTFEYNSPCIVSEGWWKYRNGKIILNSAQKVMYGWTTGEYSFDREYDKYHKDIRVRILGKNRKPIECEEMKCVFKNKYYTAFTDKNGYAYFPVKQFDTIYNVGLTKQFYKAYKWKDRQTKEDYANGLTKDTTMLCFNSCCGLRTTWKYMEGSYVDFYDVNNNYPDYWEFRDVELTIKDDELIADPKNKTSLEIPRTSFVRKTKKK